MNESDRVLLQTLVDGQAKMEGTQEKIAETLAELVTSKALEDQRKQYQDEFNESLKDSIAKNSAKLEAYIESTKPTIERVKKAHSTIDSVKQGMWNKVGLAVLAVGSIAIASYLGFNWKG